MTSLLVSIRAERGRDKPKTRPSNMAAPSSGAPIARTLKGTWVILQLEVSLDASIAKVSVLPPTDDPIIASLHGLAFE